MSVDAHTTSGPVSWLREKVPSGELRKMIRYAGVSTIFVPLGQILLQIVIWVGDVRPTVANLVVATLLTPFNFLANKYWVWKNSDRERMHLQAVVFWIMALAGVVVSTLFIGIADNLVGEHPSPIVRSLAWFIAAIIGYGIVWATRYVILDKIVFVVTHHHIEEVEPHPELAE